MALTKVIGQGIDSVTVDSSGNVGIGTTSPSAVNNKTLHVYAGAGQTAGLRVTGNGGTGVDFKQTSDGSAYVINRENADIIISTNNTERMRITSGGTVLVGSTDGTPYASNVSGAGFYSSGAISGSVDGLPAMYLNRLTSDGTIADFRKNSTTVGTISVTGSATSYNTSSDYRLKENVTDITDATERLKQLNPVRFNFIADADTTVDGFLAHEVQDVVPEAITGTKDAVDADGNPVYQGIDQSKLVPLLVATIQELEARIAALETA